MVNIRNQITRLRSARVPLRIVPISQLGRRQRRYRGVGAIRTAFSRRRPLRAPLRDSDRSVFRRRRSPRSRTPLRITPRNLQAFFDPVPRLGNARERVLGYLPLTSEIVSFL